MYVKSDEVWNLPLCHKNKESKSIKNNSKEVEVELFKSKYFMIEIHEGLFLQTYKPRKLSSQYQTF